MVADATTAPAVPQHLQALAHANAIRIERAELKRKLSAGAIELRHVLEHEAMATARVADVLLAIPRLGPIKVGRLLSRADVSPSKLAGGLNARQRERLLAAVAGDELPLPWPGPAPLPGADPDSIEALLA